MDSEIWIAIPSNILEDRDSLRAKTEKIGVIARAAAIFGVRRIYLYDIKKTVSEGPFIELLLNYLALPQYLRKKVYALQDQLRFAGQLPPLKIPSHLVPKSLSLVKKGDIREGIIILRDGRLFVDVGLESPITTAFSGTLAKSQRVTVIITSGPPNVSSKVVGKNEIQHYWGFDVVQVGNIADVISRSRPTTVLLTSRNGTPLEDIWRDISKMISNKGKCLAIFGSPKVGLLDVLARENLHLADISAYFVNLFTSQRVETVRSEEAIMAGLGILNFLGSLGTKESVQSNLDVSSSE